MSRFPQRWRTQRNAIRNANCKTSRIIKILNAHCAFGIFPVACFSECLWTPLSDCIFICMVSWIVSLPWYIIILWLGRSGALMHGVALVWHEFGLCWSRLEAYLFDFSVLSPVDVFLWSFYLGVLSDSTFGCWAAYNTFMLESMRTIFLPKENCIIHSGSQMKQEDPPNLSI